VTTRSSVQASLNRLAQEGDAVIARQHRLAEPLLAGGRRIVEDSHAGAFATGLTAGAGVFGRLALGSELSVLGGVGYARDRDGNAELRGATTIAAAVRYVREGGRLRPFAELGGWVVPHTDLRLSRAYMNGAGTAVGVGDTEGKLSALYGRLGVAVQVADSDELALFGEVGRTRLRIDGYVEPLSNANPFEAHVEGWTERLTTLRGRVQYSHAFGSRVDATVYAGGVLGRRDGGFVLATVPGFGGMAGAARDPSWAELGGRIGIRFGAATLELFANGDTGEKGVGKGVHAGLGVRLGF
jgi:hypothetical protein